MADRTTPAARDRLPGEYQPLVLALAAFAVGIACDRLAPLGLIGWLPLAVVALGLWWAVWRRGRIAWAMLPLLVALGAAGAAWHHTAWHLFDRDELARFASDSYQPVCLEGVALESPRRVPPPKYDPLSTIPTGERSRIELRIAAIRDDDRWVPAAGRCTLVVQGQVASVGVGDRLRVFAHLAEIEAPDNPGQFNYADHARADGRLCNLRADFPACLTRVEAGGWSPRTLVDGLRRHAHAQLWTYLGEARSGLAAGMFLGLREELEPETSQAFLETGTIHLLVISGLNVGILAMCLLAGSRIGLLPRGVALAATMLVTMLYAIVTDAQPPVMRATIMVWVCCLAAWVGRRPLDFNTLAAAALVVLLLNPCELFRPGTQLSFLAVATLAAIARAYSARRVDPLDRLIAETRPLPVRLWRKLERWVYRSLLASAAIWLIVCPLVMGRFHLVSPIAILLGPVLAVPVAVAMSSGFGVMLLGWLLPPLGVLFGWVCDRSLACLEYSVNAGRGMAAGHAWVSGPHEWWLWGFYGALLVWAVVPACCPPRRWRVALLALWSAVGIAGAMLPARSPDRLECMFLSVGHGCSVVVHLPDGRTLLYDAGRMGSPTSAARAIAGYLWSRGITHLDAVVLSHADADHYNALPALLRQFSVGAVYVSPMMFEEARGAVGVLQSSILDRQIPLREVWSGDRLQGGDCRIEVLHPPRRGVLGSDNANSIVLALEHRGRRILLTGDLESPGLDDVIAEAPLDCDVLLAPHHGSTHSAPPRFARWSTPEWVVVRGGPRDAQPAVTQAYTRQGGQVLHTAACGAVLVAIDADGVTVDTFRKRGPQALPALSR